MRLVGSSLSDVNFECFKQWLLKLIHFRWFFKVLAICREGPYHSYGFKYINIYTHIYIFHKLQITEAPPCSWLELHELHLSFHFWPTLCSEYSTGRGQTVTFWNLDSFFLGDWQGLSLEWSRITRLLLCLPLQGENTLLQTIFRNYFCMCHW